MGSHREPRKGIPGIPGRIKNERGSPETNASSLQSIRHVNLRSMHQFRKTNQGMDILVYKDYVSMLPDGS